MSSTVSGNTREEAHHLQNFDESSDSLDDENENNENEQEIGVSSRGRQRKLSSKVRRYFRES